MSHNPKDTSGDLSQGTCAHYRVLHGTEPGITGEGVQDCWSCVDCGTRFVPECWMLAVGRLRESINPAPDDITGLRQRIDLSPAEARIDRICRHIDTLTEEIERLKGKP